MKTFIYIGTYLLCPFLRATVFELGICVSNLDQVGDPLAYDFYDSGVSYERILLTHERKPREHSSQLVKQSTELLGTVGIEN
jgi:hypothetical protein